MFFVTKKSGLFRKSQRNWFQQQLAVEWNIRVKAPGKEESVYDKVVKRFRELEKNADKYFGNLDAVEEMCYQTKKDAERFRLEAEVVKEILKRGAFFHF